MVYRGNYVQTLNDRAKKNRERERDINYTPEIRKMDRTEYTSGTEYLLSHERPGISNPRVLGARQKARTIRILVPVDVSLSRMDL